MQHSFDWFLSEILVSAKKELSYTTTLVIHVQKQNQKQFEELFLMSIEVFTAKARFELGTVSKPKKSYIMYSQTTTHRIRFLRHLF